MVATGGGYNSFQYSGTAGNAVFAPYPVRLLGNCPQNEATGTPAFEDYKSQVWAKSAGTMVAEYWYPLQPVFYYDRDANGIPDTVAPDCVAWLGGIVDDPVDVTYNIVWPTNAPVLLVGETLLGSKRGLPEIAAQAAVEVVFDEKVQRTVDNLVYDPTKSLVRLIDPLEPRFVYLNAIPGERRDRSGSDDRQADSVRELRRHDPAAVDDRRPDLLRPAEQEAHLRGHPRRERRRRSVPAPERPDRRASASA